MSLHQLVYSSELDTARISSDRSIADELQSIQREAQRRNREINVTGLLIYSGGYFIQLLEGQHLVLRKLFEKIARDQRHCEVRQLAFLPVEERLFQSWYMGLLNLDRRHDIDSTLFQKFRRDAALASTGNVVQKRSLELLQDFKRQLQTPVSPVHERAC